MPILIKIISMNFIISSYQVLYGVGFWGSTKLLVGVLSLFTKCTINPNIILTHPFFESLLMVPTIASKEEVPHGETAVLSSTHNLPFIRGPSHHSHTGRVTLRQQTTQTEQRNINIKANTKGENIK